MQIVFMRWCVDPNGRGAVSVNPKDVTSTEHFTDARVADRWPGDDYPKEAGTRIVLRNKKEFLVQGDLQTVVDALNAAEEM